MKVILKEVVWVVFNWINLAEDMNYQRGLVNTVVNLGVLYNMENI